LAATCVRVGEPATDGAARRRYTSSAVVVTSPEDLVPDDLTARLRANGALPCGRATTVDIGERRTTILSTIVHLRVEYSSDTPTEAPRHLLLKATRNGLDASFQDKTLADSAPGI
jgi:hypothetical protein